jgi:hypothetical protein
MKFIKEIHDVILDFVERSGVGVFVTHDKVDDYLNRAQMDKFNELTGSEKAYQPGRPIPPISYPSTSKVHNDLRRFITTPVSVTLVAGKFDLPEIDTSVTRVAPSAFQPSNFSTYDYIFLNSLRTTANKDVDLLFEHELGERINSKIDPPSVTEPVAVIYDDHIQVYPTSGVSTLNFSCVRAPAPVKYEYTKDANGREVSYNDTLSWDLEWPENVHNDIMARALGYVSVPLRDAFVNQAADKKAKEI